MNTTTLPPQAAGLLKKYNIAPAPACVARLGQLISQRTADLEEIAKIVESDEVLKARVLRAASPRRGDPIEEVEPAIFRCGVDGVLVLAMADPLFQAVISSFDTLMGIHLARVDESEVGPLSEGYVASVQFSGPAAGTVFIEVQQALARKVVGTFLGVDPQDAGTTEITDILGETANVIVGNFRSNLCDAGLQCTLAVPKVEATSAFNPPEAGPGRHHFYAFKHEGHPLVVHIIVESTE